MLDALTRRFSAFAARWGHAPAYALVGLAVAALFLLIGFQGALLLAALAAIGFVIGRYQDGDPRIRSLANRAARAFGK